MRILIRADASLRIGTGHVVRCLTLAEHLRAGGAVVEFACQVVDGHLCDLVAARGFAVHKLADLSGPTEQRNTLENGKVGYDIAWERDAELTVQAVGDGGRYDWICVDHYGLDHRWETLLRPYCKRLIVVDDLANRKHDCDLLLDQNIVAEMDIRYDGLVPVGCVCLLGPAHALLQHEYAELRPQAAPREGSPQRLLVSFGGFDQYGLTEMVVEALCALNIALLETDIVLSSSSVYYPRIRALVADRPHLRLHDRVPSLASYILAADLAIGAGGTTHWERLALGLPSLVVTVAENQRAIAAELARFGLIRWLGNATIMTPAIIADEIQALVAGGLDPAWSRRCLAAVDARGADRVVAAMLAGPEMQFVRRHAVPSDESLLLEWANDSETRKNAFNPRQISPDEHRTWFVSRLRGPDDCLIFIFETQFGIPFGQVRFDRRGSFFEISYSVARAFRGRGLGAIMLKSAIHGFQEGRPGIRLVGQVKVDNPASCRIFEQLGFSVCASRFDRLVFELAT